MDYLVILALMSNLAILEIFIGCFIIKSDDLLETCISIHNYPKRTKKTGRGQSVIYFSHTHLHVHII